MAFAGILRQSTAVDVLIGPFVGSDNGDDEETGLTIAQADVRLSKNGQAAAQKNDNTTCVHDADGMYNCELDATDTNTVGQLTLFVHVAGALFVRHDFQVIEEAVYDIMFAGSATGAVPVASIAANVITTAAINDGAFTAAKFASAFLTAAKFATDTGLTPVRSNTAQAGAATTITLDASASAVNDFYNGCVVYLTSGTGVGQARIITDYDGSTKVATVSTWATNPDNTSVFAILPSGAIDVPTAASVADAVWDEDTTGHTTSGTFGEQVKTDIDAILVDTGTTLQGELDGIQTDTEDIQSRLPAALVSGRIDASVGAMAANVVTASALNADAVDEILDETIGDGSITVRQALRVILAGMAGKLSGAATTTITIRNLADSADVVVATVDADGNRSAVTVTP